MKTTVLILFNLTLFAKANAQFEIGKKLNDTIKVTAKPRTMMLTGPADIEPFSRATVNGCVFDVVFKADETVKAVFTTDKNFATAENIRVGMSYSEIKNMLPQNKPVELPGWAKYFINKSGWKIAFKFDQQLSDLSRVSFIFKDGRD